MFLEIIDEDGDDADSENYHEDYEEEDDVNEK